MATSEKSKLPSGEALVVEDDEGRGNVVRFVFHDGRIYIEARAKHEGHVVHTLVRVPRLRFVPLLMGWLNL